MKRDAIFYAAVILAAAGVVCTALGYELGLLFFVLAYLLRPALHEFGVAQKSADERQHQIYARSGNLAFVVVMVALAGLTVWRVAAGQPAGEMYTLLGIGLAARALTGLIMVGEYRRAAVLIISAAGVYVAFLVLLVEGISTAAFFGVLLGLAIVGLGQLARRFPRTIATVLVLFGVVVAVIFHLLAFQRGDMKIWLFFIVPIATAAVCLYLSALSVDEDVAPRVRTTVFGSLGAVITLVFALIILGGSDETPSTSHTVALADSTITEIQGVACQGSVQFYDDGSLEFCFLAREDTLLGQPLPVGTGVHFGPDSVFDWCFLPQDTEIQGVVCRGGGHDFQTAFHPNGQLKTAWLVEDQIVQGIPCSKFRFLSAVFGGFHGKYGGTAFHPNGQLRYCELSENITLKGQDFRRGTALRFDSDGRLLGQR